MEISKRDFKNILSLSVNIYNSPISYLNQSYQIPKSFEEAVAIQIGYSLNKNSLHLGEYKNLKKDALNYSFLGIFINKKEIKR